MTSHALEPPPLSQTVTPSQTTSLPLECDELYGWPLRSVMKGAWKPEDAYLVEDHSGWMFLPCADSINVCKVTYTMYVICVIRRLLTSLPSFILTLYCQSICSRISFGHRCDLMLKKLDLFIHTAKILMQELKIYGSCHVGFTLS